jgi:hypothetical protein
MFNSSTDENISTSDVHIGLDKNVELDYIEDFTNGTSEDLNNNHTIHDYCLVSLYFKYPKFCFDISI